MQIEKIKLEEGIEKWYVKDVEEKSGKVIYRIKLFLEW